MMAYYMLLERLDIPVRRSESPLVGKSLPAGDALFVISPTWDLAEAEIDALDDWVRQGGVLVCCHRVARELRYLPRKARVFGGGGGAAEGVLDEVESGDTLVPAAEQDLPLARDVARVNMSPDVVRIEGQPGVRGIEMTPLLRDDEGVRILRLDVDAGEVVVLGTSSFLSNTRLGKADNDILAANLAAYAAWRAPGGTLVFDEYHFGLRRRQRGWMAMGGLLLTSSAGWGVLCLTVAGFGWLIYKGRRFGVRRAAVPTSRRSKLAYVRAVGATFQAMSANRITFAALLDWFKTRCATAVGLPENTAWPAIATRLAHKTGKPTESYLQVFREGHQAAESGRLSRRRMSFLLGKLAQIESEIIDGHSESK